MLFWEFYLPSCQVRKETFKELKNNKVFGMIHHDPMNAVLTISTFYLVSATIKKLLYCSV